jgi:hypothetical protein
MMRIAVHIAALPDSPVRETATVNPPTELSGSPATCRSPATRNPSATRSYARKLPTVHLP